MYSSIWRDVLFQHSASRLARGHHPARRLESISTRQPSISVCATATAPQLEGRNSFCRRQPQRSRASGRSAPGRRGPGCPPGRTGSPIACAPRERGSRGLPPAAPGRGEPRAGWWLALRPLSPVASTRTGCRPRAVCEKRRGPAFPLRWQVGETTRRVRADSPDGRRAPLPAHGSADAPTAAEPLPCARAPRAPARRPAAHPRRALYAPVRSAISPSR